MFLSTRSRLATLTIAATTALVAPLLAAPAHAAAPVVPDGACVTELAALDAPRQVLADARTAQAAAKVIKDAAVVAYLANPTSTTLAARNTARSEYSTLRAETVAAKAARVALRAVLDTCIDLDANGFSVSNFRPDAWNWCCPELVVADLVISGLAPNAEYALSPTSLCSNVDRFCSYRASTDADGILRTSSTYPEHGWPTGHCLAWDETNQTGLYDDAGNWIRTIAVPIPAGVC